MALSTTTSGSVSGQANTQSPQLSTGSNTPLSAPGKNVQPGTATSLLSGAGGGSEGIPLNSTILPVADLNTTAQTTTVSQPLKTADSHSPNAGLLVVVAVLVILAVISLWLTRRSAKNTTI